MAPNSSHCLNAGCRKSDGVLRVGIVDCLYRIAASHGWRSDARHFAAAGPHMKLLSAVVLGLCITSALAADDTRQLVTMPAPMTQHLLSNMRDHLSALTEIQRALGSGEYQQAADVAERRIGLSSLESHGASHMAPFMPKPMQDIGTQMHRAASQFALVAQETGADGNVARAVAALSKVTEQCVACHAAYRAH